MISQDVDGHTTSLAMSLSHIGTVAEWRICVFWDLRNRLGSKGFDQLINAKSSYVNQRRGSAVSSNGR